MVALDQVKLTNSRVVTELAPDLVAVFAGGTAGIGELAMRAFARDAVRPRIYFIGRSEAQGERLAREMQEENAAGQYVFLKADFSLMSNVDKVAREIREREKTVNLLVMTQGTLNMGPDTPEGIPLMTAVSQHSRIRLAYDLLPQLRQASGLRRVVSVLAATKEGKLRADDLHRRKVPLLDARGHGSTAMTLSLEALARQAPEVSFVHNFPGSVRTSLIRADSGLLLRTVGYLWDRSPFNRQISHDECAARHEFLCVSARYPPRRGKDGDAEGAAVPVDGGMDVAVGTDGQKGSGVYSVDELGESASGQVVTRLAKYRDEGVLDKIWEHYRGEFVRITGAMDI